MAVMVEQYPELPVIVATVTGKMTIEDARTIFSESAAIMDTMSGPVFRITDVRQMDTDFTEVTAMLKEASHGQPGTTSDPRLQVVMVGGHALTRFYADAMRQSQFGGVAVPVFQHIEDALTYITYRLSQTAQPTG